MKNKSLISYHQKTLHIIWMLLFALFASQTALATNSLRFFGNPTNDDHRVKIQVDDPANSNPGPPADIGSEDFTLEFWMKTTSGNNGSGGSCGANNSWINGNIIFDRDRFNQGRNFGLSIVNGVLRFGTMNGSFGARTICGATTITDGQWHHVAIQRRRSDGLMSIYVDGNLDVQADGPDGDISYPDGGSPQSGYAFSDPYIVIGAEKHDANVAAYPSYFGYIDEVRLSNSIRYNASFTVPTVEFGTDSNTVALYHFNEGSGTVVNDTSGASGGPSNGEIRPGVVWSTDTPLSGGGSPVPGTIGLTVTGDSVSEADGTYSFTVTRSGGEGAVSVAYEIGATGGTATSGSDYQVTAQAATGTLNWNDSDTSTRTLTIDIIDDIEPAEPDETVLLTLTSPTGGASLGNNSATLTIQDNDIPGTISLTETVANIDESAGSRSFTVARSGGSGTVTVAYEIGSIGTTASAGTDFQAATGTLTWTNGDTSSQTLPVTILDDTSPESDETVVLSLSNPSGSASLGNSSAVLTILDDDAPGTLQFALPYQAVNEDAGTGTITVNRTNGTGGVVTVNYTATADSATADVDYGTIQPMSGTLTFQDGAAVATITVPLTNDTLEETLETINFSLSSPSGGATLGSRNTMIFAILDDDSPLIIPASVGGGAYNPLFLLLILFFVILGRRDSVLNRSLD